MNETIRKPPGLYLEVESAAWNVECKHERWHWHTGPAPETGLLQIKQGADISDAIRCDQAGCNYQGFRLDSGGQVNCYERCSLQWRLRTCPCCHGKGTRRIRLVGMVKPSPFGDSRLSLGLSDGKPAFTFNNDEVGHRWITSRLAEKHRAGTLRYGLMASKERPWGLRIEEVPNDD